MEKIKHKAEAGINSRPDNGNSRTDGRCAEYAVKSEYPHRE